MPPDGGSEVGSVGGWVKTRAQGGGFVEEKRSRQSAGHHRLSPGRVLGHAESLVTHPCRARPPETLL